MTIMLSTDIRDPELDTPKWLKGIEGLFDSINEGISIVQSNRIVYANSPLAKLLGFTRGGTGRARSPRVLRRKARRVRAPHALRAETFEELRESQEIRAEHGPAAGAPGQAVAPFLRRH